MHAAIRFSPPWRGGSGVRREVSPTPCAGCAEALAADGLQVVELLGAAEVGRQDLNHFDCLDFALGSANHAHVRVAL